MRSVKPQGYLSKCRIFCLSNRNCTAVGCRNQCFPYEPGAQESLGKSESWIEHAHPWRCLTDCVTHEISTISRGDISFHKLQQLSLSCSHLPHRAQFFLQEMNSCYSGQDTHDMFCVQHERKYQILSPRRVFNTKTFFLWTRSTHGVLH